MLEQEINLKNDLKIEDNDSDSIKTNEFKLTVLEKKKKKKIREKKDKKAIFCDLFTSTLFFTLFCSVWLFVIAMVPLFSPTYTNLTPVFSKPSSYSKVFELTILGIITLIFFAIFVALAISSLIFRISLKQKGFVYFSKNKKVFNVLFLCSFIFLFLINILLFLNAYIPPLSANYALASNELIGFITQQFGTEKPALVLDQANKDQLKTLLTNCGIWNQFEAQIQAGGLTWDTFATAGNESATSNVINWLSNTNFLTSNNNTIYTTMYSINQNTIYHNAGWYIVIVFFSLALIFFVIITLINIIVYFDFFKVSTMKEKFSSFREWVQKVQKNNKQKRLNKKKRKEILKEESELLDSLEEVNDEETIKGMSQEELQEKIKANNEIRSKIRELQRRQQELKKAQSKKQKEKINKRPLRPKKQEIAIPDEELEEIFKNIEID